MDEKEAYAIAFANLKGGKDKDVPQTARALRYFRNLPKYKSNKEVGQIFGVSGEIVGEFLSYFKLPEAVQRLFEERKLTQLEQVRRLSQLKRKYPDVLETIVNAAHELSGLKSHDTRYVIEYMLRHPEITAQQAREIISRSKTKIEHEYYVMTLLTGDEYKMLRGEALKRNISENALASEIVKDWLQSRNTEQ